MHVNNLTANKVFNLLAILFAFTIPLSIGAYTILAGLLLLTWLWEGNFQEKWILIRQQKFFQWLFIFFVFLALTLIWSDNLEIGLKYLRKYYFILLIPMFYTSLKSQYIPTILQAFVSSMVISELLSYMIYFEIMPIQYKASWSTLDPSPFMSRGMYSLFLAFTVFLMLIQLTYKRLVWQKKLIYLFFLLTMTFNLFMNAGRTGQFALFLSSIIFIFIHYRLAVYKTLLVSFFSSLIIFITVFYTSANFQQRSIETYNSVSYLLNHNKPLSGDSLGQRIMMWQSGFDILIRNPFGVGLGDDRSAYQLTLSTQYPEYRTECENFSDFHNTYLQIAVNSGFLAVILFLVALFYAFFTLSKQKEHQTLGTIMLTLLLMYMLIGNFPAAYLTPLFALILGTTLSRPITKSSG